MRNLDVVVGFKNMTGRQLRAGVGVSAAGTDVLFQNSDGPVMRTRAHCAAGGRTFASGPHQGIGRDNIDKSPAIAGFTLTAGQSADLIAFLQSLTDQELLRDPRLANPWSARRTR